MSVSSGTAVVCPLCERAPRQYLFSRHGLQVFRCANCGLVRAEPHDGRPAEMSGRPTRQIQDQPTSSTQRRAADGYVATLNRRGASRSGVLAVVESGHAFLAAAAEAGYEIVASLDIGAVESTGIPAGSYETAVVLFQLEKAVNPVAALERIHEALVPGATLMVATPSLDSLPARLLRNQWPEWMPGNLSYFDLQTIQSCCLRSGFAEIEWTPESRDYTLDHVDRRAATLAPSLLTRATWASASSCR